MEEGKKIGGYVESGRITRRQKKKQFRRKRRGWIIV